MTDGCWRGDVIVAGAGPAGSTCATLLARTGLRVLLVAGSPSTRWRPVEIVSPSTVRLLRQHGLAVPGDDTGAARCRGVEGFWDGQFSFFDYEIYACGPGIALRRDILDAQLVDVAVGAGAELSACSKIEFASCDDERGWTVTISSNSGYRRARAPLLIEAMGRQGRALTAGATRHYLDSLVALACPLALPANHLQTMLLEASSNGWWYSSCDARGDGAVVLLSDRDLLPRGGDERVQWFREMLAGTRLMRARLRNLPERVWLHGIDARTSRRSALFGRSNVCIGDAAFSVDPLSGAGILRSLETASHAAVAVTAFLRDRDTAALARYGAWASASFDGWLATKNQVYRAGDPALWSDEFWSRRIALTAYG
jgi:flavin-dependent dehydrogenase